MTIIIDYGVGNLYSLQCSFKAIGQEISVSSDPAQTMEATSLVLPGVGSFGDAAAKLRATGLGEVIVERAKKGVPLLGICLGMQLLFERSYEYGQHNGLGLLSGEIQPMKEFVDPSLKIPHIGWNDLEILRESEILTNTKHGDFVYFVHSFAAVNCDDTLIASVEYGARITACVGKGNVFGCQFHPEKSGKVGLNILRAFCMIGA
ncbi:MAG: imidazole glycerol phosphate synthase subunit HisH [Eggerthellaceae bacterium]|nr:imidazole glycerol phosphate synthase subunit HisH [Eggerthellaceae bacterium]